MNIKKLSTAMLRGMKKTKPAQGQLYDSHNNGFCALGAAAFAMGAVDCTEEPNKKNNKLEKALNKHWRNELRMVIPQTDLTKKEQDELGQEFSYKNKPSLQALIIHANDDLNWRRDRIARFVKRLGF